MPLRLALLILLLVPAFATPSAAAVRGPVDVSLESCMPGQATFAASIGTRRASERPEMRFSLQVRAPGSSRWRALAAPGFGEWTSPITAVRRFEYRKEVRNLAPGEHYRTLVRFRWRSAEGRVLATAQRRSRVCRQADLRPDLRPGQVFARSTDDPQVVRYLVRVRNTGRTDAGPSSLVLSVDDRVLPAEAVLGVPAFGMTVTEILGPPCRMGLAILVDAEGQVAEVDETDGQAEMPCPQVEPPAAGSSSESRPR